MKTITIAVAAVVLLAPRALIGATMDDVILCASNYVVTQLNPLDERMARVCRDLKQVEVIEQELAVRKAPYHKQLKQMEALLHDPTNAAVLLRHVYGMLVRTNPTARVWDFASDWLAMACYTHPVMVANVMTGLLDASTCCLGVKGQLIELLWDMYDANTNNVQLQRIASAALQRYMKEGEETFREDALVALLGRGGQLGIDPSVACRVIYERLATETDWDMRLHYYELLHGAKIWNASFQNAIDTVIMDPARDIWWRSCVAADLLNAGMIDSNKYEIILREYNAWKERREREQRQRLGPATLCTDQQVEVVL